MTLSSLPLARMQPRPSRRALLLGAAMSAGLAALAGGSAGAQDIPPNTEAPGPSSLGVTGFSIQLDTVTLEGDRPPSAAQRAADLAAPDLGLDIRFTGLAPEGLLNVSTAGGIRTAPAGAEIVFHAYTNYAARVERAEVLVFDRDPDTDLAGRTPRARLPIAPNGLARWTMPAAGAADMVYVLRVADAQGRIDETAPLPLRRRADAEAPGTVDSPAQVRAGEGESRRARSAIPVRGGEIQVTGTGAPPGSTVRVMGQDIPVDPDGTFVFSRIVAPGSHTVTVEAGEQRWQRTIEVPRSDGMTTGLVELTLFETSEADRAADPDLEALGTDGRLSVFTDQVRADGTRLRFALDTGPGEIDDIFSRIDDPRPDRVLERLRAEDVYPTYGDDSAAEDLAPSAGRIFARLERDGLRLTWGDFRAETGSVHATGTRTLYGAQALWESRARDARGRARVQVAAEAAAPDQAAARDVLRGTGGSVYFLSRRDIQAGSETLTVAVVDDASGIIRDSRVLGGDEDELDTFQGVVLLDGPLSGFAPEGFTSDPDSADRIVLIVEYDYTPSEFDPDGQVVGARAEATLAEGVRAGIRAQRDDSGLDTRTLASGDVTWSFGTESRARIAVTDTDGAGPGRARALDSGLVLTREEDGPGGRAVTGSVDLALDDLGWGKGRLRASHDHRTAGFSTVTTTLEDDQTQTRLDVDAALTETTRLQAGTDVVVRDTSPESERDATHRVGVVHTFGDTTDVTAEIRQHRQSDATREGQRTDLALGMERRVSETLAGRLFGQTSLAAEGDMDRRSRAGIGVTAALSDRLDLEADVSAGDGGPGGTARLGFAPTAGTETYIGFAITPEGAGLGGGDRDGSIFAGGRSQITERTRVMAERTITPFGDRPGRTDTFGVSHTLDDTWTLSGALDLGTVEDDALGTLERRAVSAGASGAGTDWSGGARLELRTEDGTDGAQDRTTWGLSADARRSVSAGVTLLGDADVLLSEAETPDGDGEYVELSFGTAWRPVQHDRIDLLGRVSYLRDLPGADQIGRDGTTDGPEQVSRIVSLDANWRATPTLTLGGKYGLRASEITPRDGDPGYEATGHLGILRADIHIAHSWDVTGEVRGLWTEETETTERGALAGVWRQVGENAKVGVGYEWGSVSSDPADISYDGRGAFLSVIAAF